MTVDAMYNNVNLKFKQTRKKKYDVYVCMPERGTQVFNRLEGANYITDDNTPFVISGTVGETSVIDPNKLADTYTFADGYPITSEALSSRVKNNIIDWVRISTRQDGIGINYAAHLPAHIKNFPVQTSWGDVLYANMDGIPHGKGDFLVCSCVNGVPNLDDIWVVNGEVFPTTYDMRSFPGLGTAIAKEIPVPKSIMTSVNNDIQERRKEKIRYIVNSLRQRGNTVGKINNKDEETCSFSVNNGTYGVVLFINEGDPVVGSSSISVMYHNNNNWQEAATWFIDDFGMDESINKLHLMINGNTSLDGLAQRAKKALKNVDEIDKFNGYTVDMQKPTYFKQLLKTYEYVKDKLVLSSLDNSEQIITQTGEEPIHWRIDFKSGLCDRAILFMDVDPDKLTACVQTSDTDEHYEDDFEITPNGYKRAFNWMASIMKELGLN